MILVPLVAVLYLLALGSFAIAGYYGFRLTTMARKMKVMIMITQDGPETVVCGIFLLAVSQVTSFLEASSGISANDFFVVTSVVLLVGAAMMFAFGFHKMYSIYLNERARMKVNSILEDLLDKESANEENAKWQGEFR
ncbi:MAG TPA: hypothetical protein VFF30_13985 [Nitrososphaerales archaeon]|nr:hypothetical protein [Nitrososphaerales archaeon]